MEQKKGVKWVLWSVLSIVVIFLVLIFTCHFGVVKNASGRTYDDENVIPYNRCGLLLATSPTTSAGAHNFYFDNRIKSAVELYNAGKIDKIIASGGDYTAVHKFGCDEPAAIRDSLVAKGIPANRIFLDYDGVRTLNSIVKAKDIYGLDSVTIISQKYHNERAIFQADHYGLCAIGYNAAPSHIRRSRIKTSLREYLARLKMVFDLSFGAKPAFNSDGQMLEIINSNINQPAIEIVDTFGLRIYYPHYSNIDLVCGVMPSKNDESVIFVAEAAFTGKAIDTFYHKNIAGDHVAGGKRYAGYCCKRNNGAFVYYNGKPKFLHKNYSAELDGAELNGGCGFAQEMMIHEGKEVPHTRSDSSTNEFRALSLINDRLAVVDSKGKMKFRDFIDNLIKAGVTEALYLDMGSGWNYSWYRDTEGTAVEIHSTIIPYTTNWVTFYK